MRVREATPGDADAIREVHRESITGLGPAAYTDEQVRAWARGVEEADYRATIADDETYVVVAEGTGETAARGDVVAFGSLAEAAPDGYAADVDVEVTGVYVHPDAVRRGVGSAVLADLQRRARELDTERVGLSASLNAVPFYETHGYERVREYAHEFSAALSTGVEGTVVEMYAEL